MSAETDHILHVFNLLLQGPTGDGKAKRDAGLKEHWSIDSTHLGAAARHCERWDAGETHDPDSGCHPLVHAAWRLLAVAYQELAERGEEPCPPHPHVEAAGQRQFWEDVKETTNQDMRRLARSAPHHPDYQFGARAEGESLPRFDVV